MRTRSMICAAALGASSLAGPAALADEVADFYKGKTLSMIVASGPGGGYDLYARTLIRHFPRHIAGNPNIVIQYLPGGGGIVAANTLYGVSPRDGTAMGLLASSTFVVAAVGDRQTKFENLNFSFIGNMNEEADTCSVWRTTGINSVADLKNREIIIGTAGPGSNSHTFPLAMSSVLGLKIKLIPGYQGGAQIRTSAMERGELDGTCGIFVSTLGAQFARQLKEGDMKVILQMGLARHPSFKDVPNALELATDPDGKAALQMLFAQLALGRPILGPPEIPPARLKALQAGFKSTIEDPQMQADAKKSRIELRWFDGDKMREVMASMQNAPENVKANVRRLLDGK
jgi:tripartite-type tricarboxylate transporter receptor subunit TctC